MSKPSPDEIAAIRRFTRFYTRKAEVLDESLLASGFPLADARVLYELAVRSGSSAADLSRDLGIDPGYLSRILKRFERAGLLAREGSPTDGRRSHLALTEAGTAAFAPLDRGSAEQVAGWLAPLSIAERRRLVAALREVEALLDREDATTASKPDASSMVLRPHRIGDIGWIAHRQGRLYGEEYGWDITYEALVAEIMAKFARDFDPVTDGSWIAERDGSILGSVFLVRAEPGGPAPGGGPAQGGVGKLRLLYVEPGARGTGLGARLVEACIAGARERGYRALTLWTNDCLTAARRIYERCGFRLVASERHHSFGHDLVGETWTLDL